MGKQTAAELEQRCEQLNTDLNSAERQVLNLADKHERLKVRFRNLKKKSQVQSKPGEKIKLLQKQVARLYAERNDARKDVLQERQTAASLRWLLLEAEKRANQAASEVESYRKFYEEHADGVVRFVKDSAGNIVECVGLRGDIKELPDLVKNLVRKVRR